VGILFIYLFEGDTSHSLVHITPAIPSHRLIKIAPGRTQKWTYFT